MEIKLNVEKKHFWVLVCLGIVLMGLLGGLMVYGGNLITGAVASTPNWDDANKFGHGEGCYVNYGIGECLEGFTRVLNGRMGGIENYGEQTNSKNSEIPRPSHICIDKDKESIDSWSGYDNRLMRANDAGTGMDAVNPNCAICCRGGTYTAFGTESCNENYEIAYNGKAGGIELYRARNGVLGETICIDNLADGEGWSGYSTRMMRFKEQSGHNFNGMDQVTPKCVVCVAK